MSNPGSFRSALRAAAAAAVAAFGLAGCALSMNCGDALVTQPGKNFFLELTALGMIRDGYSVNLPAVPLSKAGTTEFHVTGLPAGNYGYRFYVTGSPVIGDIRNFSPTPLSAGDADTVISFRAVDPGGKTLFTRDVRLGSLQWVRGGAALYPTEKLFGATATDYRLSVTVRHPSPYLRELLRIDASGGNSPVRPVQVQRSATR